MLSCKVDVAASWSQNSLKILEEDAYATKLADYITLLDHNYHKKRIETLPLLIREVDVYSEKKDSKYHINLTEDELAEYKNMHSK